MGVNRFDDGCAAGTGLLDGVGELGVGLLGSASVTLQRLLEFRYEWGSIQKENGGYMILTLHSFAVPAPAMQAQGQHRMASPCCPFFNDVLFARNRILFFLGYFL